MIILKKIFIVFICIALLFGAFYFWLSGKYVVPIMMYHSVSNGEKTNVNVISPERFKKHMDYLKQHGYTVISLRQLIEMIQFKKTFKKKYVVITFDDGFENNYTHAFPVLKQYGFPATIFTSTVTLGKKGWLKWYQIFEMEQSGIAMESHTLTQAYLPDQDKKKQWEEIFNSKLFLERNLGHSIDFIAYPTGGFSKQIKQMVKKAGYRGACSTNRGPDRFNRDVYALKRIRFGNKDNSDFILWAKLSGYYNLFRSIRKSH